MLKMSMRLLVANKRLSLSVLAGLAALTLSGNAAHAGSYPASVVGNWNGLSNNTEVFLGITTQGSVGVCKSIVGIMADGKAAANSTIQGFYCPSTGRISFLRKSKTTGLDFQVYTANLNQVSSVLSPRMDGMFAEEGNPNALGEYGFEVSGGSAPPK